MSDAVLAVALVLAALGAAWLTSDLREVRPSTAQRDRAATVSVVVPARDEEATLPLLLASLRRLSPGVGEVVVVDDASDDATAAVAREAGATVLTATPPAAGWTGKAWACHLGASATSGELLLFLDADTVLLPGSLGGLLDLHERHRGLVSVQPFHTVVRPYEQLSAYFNVVALLASGAFVRRPGRRPMAFGPCLLTSRADYERAGGHTAVRGEILDDVQLARAYRRAGLDVRCAVGGQTVRMRSYPDGVRQLAAGWTKNIASGASSAAPGPLLATVAWVCAHHAVAVGLLLALVAATTGADLGHGSLVLWSVTWIGACWQLRSLLRRAGDFRWWAWLLFPLPLLAFDVLFVRSAALTVVRRSVQWRGRAVDLDVAGSATGRR